MATLITTVTQYSNLNLTINLNEYGTTVNTSSLVSAIVLENVSPGDEVFDELSNSVITKTSQSTYNITGYYGEDIEFKPVIKTTDGNAPEDIQIYRTFEAANSASYQHVFYYYPEIFTYKTVEYTFNVCRIDESFNETCNLEQYDVQVYADISRHSTRAKQLVRNQSFPGTDRPEV